jgi:S1-C subfamily serine protease
MKNIDEAMERQAYSGLSGKLRKGMVYMETDINGGAIGQCLGAQVTNDAVLTAAHCVSDSDGAEKPLLELDRFVYKNRKLETVSVFKNSALKKVDYGYIVDRDNDTAVIVFSSSPAKKVFNDEDILPIRSGSDTENSYGLFAGRPLQKDESKWEMQWGYPLHKMWMESGPVPEDVFICSTLGSIHGNSGRPVVDRKGQISAVTSQTVQKHSGMLEYQKDPLVSREKVMEMVQKGREGLLEKK